MVSRYRSLLQAITPPLPTLAWMLVLLLAGSLLTLANPWMAGLLTDSLISTGQPGRTPIQYILLIWFALVAARSGIAFVSSYHMTRTGERMQARLRALLFRHMLALPMKYYHEGDTGDTLALLTYETGIVSRFVTQTLVQLLPLLVTLAGAFVMMLTLDVQITLLATLLLPLYYLAMKLIGRRLRPLSRAAVEAYSRMFSRMEESIAMLMPIKSFVRESREAERFDDTNRGYLDAACRQGLIDAAMGPSITLLAGAGLLLLLWLAAGKVEAGQMETGELVSLMLYAMLMTQPISSLANVYGQVQSTRGAADRLVDFMAHDPEPANRDGPDLPPVRGAIEFRDIGFSYPGRDPVFENYSLSIPAGETLALTGPNGAGKSTLAWLLMGFDRPQTGQVLIDGHDIAAVNLESLRRQIGIVAQSTLLLNGTVRENMRFGNPRAGDAELARAAHAAGASTFIEQLPQGWETVIGDQGIRLSGGQRQRLSLARTLVKDPPILILDEATAMFDPQGEEDFIRECLPILESRTVILITHRPASLALADRVVRLGLERSRDPDRNA